MRSRVMMTPFQLGRPSPAFPPQSLLGRRDTATNPLEGLKTPERAELASALRRCNGRDSEHIALLVEAINRKEVRAPAVALLCKQEYLIRRPSNRGKLLEALLPYASELPVQAYAMMSLRDPLYSRSLAVCAPAARIIDADKAQRDPTITYELLDLAARKTPYRKDGAATIACILLKDSELSAPQLRTAVYNARLWYAEHRTAPNPWLSVIAQNKDKTSLRLLTEMLEGALSDPRDYPVLKNFLTLPLLPHEIAFTASVLTIAARKIGRMFGQNNNLAATTAAMAATTIIIGGRYLLRAHAIDKFNASRDYERLEAAAYLSSMLHEVQAESPALDRKLNAKIRRILSDNARSFLQEPHVRAAASLALSKAWDVAQLVRQAAKASRASGHST